MKNLDTDRKRGRWLAWKWAALASLCLAGTLFALDEIPVGDVSDGYAKDWEGSVRDEPFSGKNIANNARSVSYVIRRTPASIRDAKSKSAPPSLLEAEFGTWEKGEMVLLWEQRKVFAEDRLFLYQTDDAKCDGDIGLDLKKRKGDALRAAGIDVPVYLKRVRFPLESNFWFGGMVRNFQLVRRTESGVVVSAQVGGFRLMWEYDPKKAQWLEYPGGEVFAEPQGDIVPATLSLLWALKRNGCLEGVSPENYPLFCLFSSKEPGVEKNMTPQKLLEIVRTRERVLREAVLAEFSSDASLSKSEE